MTTPRTERDSNDRRSREAGKKDESQSENRIKDDLETVGAKEGLQSPLTKK